MRGLIRNSWLFTLAVAAAIVFFVFLSCSKAKKPQRFVEYLKMVKELRARVTPEQGLQDSTRALQKKYHLNPENEIAKLKNDPDGWKTLLEALAAKK